MPLLLNPITSMTKTEVPTEAVLQKDNPFLSLRIPSHCWNKEVKGISVSNSIYMERSLP